MHPNFVPVICVCVCAGALFSGRPILVHQENGERKDSATGAEGKRARATNGLAAEDGAKGEAVRDATGLWLWNAGAALALWFTAHGEGGASHGVCARTLAPAPPAAAGPLGPSEYGWTTGTRP